MPTNFLQTLFEFLSSFWPFTIVEQWEEAIFYYCGHARRKRLRPGLYLFLPWFTDVRAVSIVPTPISTPLLNIMLRDGKTLSYSATAIVRITDPWLALNEIDDYHESTGELLASRTSEKLAEIDAARLDPDAGRRRLVTDLVRWLNDDTNRYGVEVLALRFTNFAINQRAYRLLTDSALGPTAWD